MVLVSLTQSIDCPLLNAKKAGDIARYDEQNHFLYMKSELNYVMVLDFLDPAEPVLTERKKENSNLRADYTGGAERAVPLRHGSTGLRWLDVPVVLGVLGTIGGRLWWSRTWCKE